MANKLLAIIDAALHGRRMPQSATRAQIQRAETIINRHKKARLKAEDKEDEDDDNDTGAPPPPENGSCSTCSGTGKCKDCDGSGKAPADDDDEEARAHHHHRGGVKLTKPRNLREGINQLMRLTAQVNAQVGGKTGPSTPAAAANPFPHLAMLETIKAQYDGTRPERASKFLSDNHEAIMQEMELQRWAQQDERDRKFKAELAQRRAQQQDALNREQEQKAELARLEAQAAELRKRLAP